MKGGISMIKKTLPLFLVLFVMIFSVSISRAVVQKDLRFTEDKVVSAYDSDVYIVSYKLKNFDKSTANNVVVTCQIVDGYGEELYTQKKLIGSLSPGQELAGEFNYFRPSTSFQVFHRLSVEHK